MRKEDNATAVDIEMGDGDSIVPSTIGFEEETTQQPVERQSLLGGGPLMESFRDWGY